MLLERGYLEEAERGVRSRRDAVHWPAIRETIDEMLTSFSAAVSALVAIGALEIASPGESEPRFEPFAKVDPSSGGARKPVMTEFGELGAKGYGK